MFDYSKVKQTSERYGNNPLPREGWIRLYDTCLKISTDGVFAYYGPLYF